MSTYKMALDWAKHYTRKTGVRHVVTRYCGTGKIVPGTEYQPMPLDEALSARAAGTAYIVGQVHPLMA